MELKKSKTYQNLAKAYAGECMARTRYKFIAYGAKKEGYKNIANVIETIIYQEFNHARMLYTFIETADDKTIDNVDVCAGFPFRQKWNLLDNLKFAAEDEGIEADEVYPAYAATAREEGFEDIAGLFENLIGVENCHRQIFTQIYEQMKNGTLYKKKVSVKWKCVDCGYEEWGKEAFKQCPLCQAQQGSVELILEPCDEA